MSGYITFWSKDYVKQIEKHKDKGPFCVVYGSNHTQMPSVSSLKIGDIIYPVAIIDKTLCVMARLPIEKIEVSYEYLMRETGFHFSSQIPEGVLLKKQGIYGEFNIFKDGSGYNGKVELPENIHTIINEDTLVIKPHMFHQEPITCCSDMCVSGSKGSSIESRLIPLEIASKFLFGKTKSTQKPLKLSKDGSISSTSLSGFIRKMSDETFEFMEKMFE